MEDVIIPHISLRNFHLKLVKSIVLTGRKGGEQNKSQYEKRGRRLPLYNIIIVSHIHGNGREKHESIDLMKFYTPYFKL